MARRDFEWMREIQDVASRFKDYFENFEPPTPPQQQGERPAKQRYDLYVEDNNVCVEVELPGMKKEDLRITMAGDAVEVSGERKPVRKDGTPLLRGNRKYGAFTCRIELPKEADLDLANASASYTDGVLRIMLPQAGGKGFGFSIPVE